MKTTQTLLIIILLLGCNDNKRQMPDQLQDITIKISENFQDYPIIKNDNIITINVPEDFSQYNNYYFDEIIDSVWYLPLETGKDFNLVAINKVVYYQNHYYIMDKSLNVLLRFAYDGSYVDRIGQNGKGPGEYQSPTAFQIIDNHILVNDDRGGKIIHYEINGKYIKEERMYHYISDFYPYENDKYIVDVTFRDNYHSELITDYSLMITNRDWELIGRTFKLDEKNRPEFAESRKSITTSGDEIIFSPAYNYIVYSMENNAWKEKYYINVGNRKLPENFLYKKTLGEFYQDFKNADYSYIMGEVYETEQFLFTTIHHGNYLIPLFYSKNTGKVFYNKTFRLPNPITVKSIPVGFPQHVVGKIDNTLIGYYDALTLVSRQEVNDSLPKDKAIPWAKVTGEFFNTIKEDDNPVLVFIRFKEI